MLFGIEESDVLALRQSFVTEKSRVSPRDPFISQGKPRGFSFKHEPVKPSQIHVQELKLDQSKGIPSQKTLDNLRTFTAQFYNAAEIP